MKQKLYYAVLVKLLMVGKRWFGRGVAYELTRDAMGDADLYQNVKVEIVEET